MPQGDKLDVELWLIIGALVIFFFILFLFKLVSLFSEFHDELRYLNDEIKRTSGSERKFWMRKKRRLWLSLIPFFKYR